MIDGLRKAIAIAHSLEAVSPDAPGGPITHALRQVLVDEHRKEQDDWKSPHPSAAAHVCDRCLGLIDGYRRDEGTTRGFYPVKAPSYWAAFALLCEEEVCECCMWCDPRYIAAHGSRQHEIRRENRTPTIDEAIAELEAATERCAEDTQTVAEEMRAGGASELEVARITRCEDCTRNRVVLAALKSVSVGATPWRS